MVMTLLGKLSAVFDVKLTYSDFLSHPTISSLAKLLDSHLLSGDKMLYYDVHLDLDAEVEKHAAAIKWY